MQWAMLLTNFRLCQIEIRQCGKAQKIIGGRFFQNRQDPLIGGIGTRSGRFIIDKNRTSKWTKVEPVLEALLDPCWGSFIKRIGKEGVEFVEKVEPVLEAISDHFLRPGWTFIRSSGWPSELTVASLSAICDSREEVSRIRFLKFSTSEDFRWFCTALPTALPPPHAN